jgi:hypothetical protein
VLLLRINFHAVLFISLIGIIYCVRIDALMEISLCRWYYHLFVGHRYLLRSHYVAGNS